MKKNNKIKLKKGDEVIVLSGKVVSSNSNKTIIVEVERRVKHKMYKKIIKRAKKYHAHDENNTYKKVFL